MFNKQLNSDNIRVLKQIQSIGYKSAIIAGGAVRDTFYRKPISDIDIYIWDEKYSNEKVSVSHPFANEKLTKQLFKLEDKSYKHAFSKEQPIIPDEDEDDDIFSWNSIDDIPAYYGFSNQITQIVNMIKDGMIYQIISTEIEPIEFVNKKFGIYLSRCYCDGIKMRYTNEFLIDHTNKTLTFDGEFSLYEYKYMQEKYLPKIKRRFPNYTVVDKLKDGLIKAYKRQQKKRRRR